MSWKSFRKTIVTGILVLVPLGFILYMLLQLFMITRAIAEPIQALLPVDRVVGLIIVNLIGLGMLVLLCFFAGLMMRFSVFSTRIEQLDRAMSERVPGYAIAKGIVGGAVQDEASVEGLRPVIVSVADGTRLGFEVERTAGGGVVVFLPNVPNPQTGVAAAFPAEAVEHVDMPPHRVIEMLQFYGKGLASKVEAARAGTTLGDEDPQQDPGHEKAARDRTAGS